jgi:hypothetical protein
MLPTGGIRSEARDGDGLLLLSLALALALAPVAVPVAAALTLILLLLLLLPVPADLVDPEAMIGESSASWNKNKNEVKQIEECEKEKTCIEQQDKMNRPSEGDQ